MKQLFKALFALLFIVLMAQCSNPRLNFTEEYNVEVDVQHWYNEAQLATGRDTIIVENKHGVPLYRQVRVFYVKYRNIIADEGGKITADTAHVWYGQRLRLVK